MPSIYETPHSILAPERERKKNTAYDLKQLSIPLGRKSRGKLYLRDDVTLNPKLVYSRGLESRDEAVGRCLPPYGKPK